VVAQQQQQQQQQDADAYSSSGGGGGATDELHTEARRVNSPPATRMTSLNKIPAASRFISPKSTLML